MANLSKHSESVVGVVALAFPSLADDVVVLRPWSEADVPQQLEAFGDSVFKTHSDWAPCTDGQASV